MQGGREGGQFKKLKWVLQPKKPNHPAKRWGHSCVVHNSKLFLFGGNHSSRTHEGIHRLDCETLENNPLEYKEQPEIRESHSCLLHQDSLYVYGGCINQELTNDLVQLDISGPHPGWRRIEQTNPIPPRESHNAVMLQDQYILIYGGTSPEETYLDEFWMFDLKSRTWFPIQEIHGKIDACMGVTMTPIGEFIYSFGGEWGEGEDSQYSNDLFQLMFQEEIRAPEIPPLMITKVEASGVRPNPRTGHAAVNYKSKMLLILGGQGVSSKRASILYNDLWAFDLRTCSWSQLPIENRTVFRPRTNFTANIYKNTLYVFGGFINLTSFKSTDQLVTLTLNETRQAIRHEFQYRPMAVTQNQHHPPKYCTQCRFEFVEQERPIVKQQKIMPNLQMIKSSTQNILYAAKFIQTPLEALGLIVDSVTRIHPQLHKTLSVQLHTIPSSDQDPDLKVLLEKNYLSISVNGMNLNFKDLEILAQSYRCEVDDPAFDLKNGLLRLGKEVLMSQLFDDGVYHAFLITGEGLKYSSFSIEELKPDSQKGQMKVFYNFLSHNGINLSESIPNQLKMHIGLLNKSRQGGLELKIENNKLVTDEKREFSTFMQDFFLVQKSISLFVQGEKVELIPFEKYIRAEGTDREQEPTTDFFSKVHLIVNEPLLNGKDSLVGSTNDRQNSVRLYAQGRKVGLYTKEPSVSGFIELNDASSLNFPRTRCESFDIRAALKEEIKGLLQERRKRPSIVPIAQLQQEQV